MEQFQADIDLALLHLKQLEMRTAEQRSRIAQLQTSGESADTAEELLSTLEQTLALVRMRVARISRTNTVENASQPDDGLPHSRRDEP